MKSEDQEEELLSSVFVSGLPSKGRGKGEKVLVGGSTGVLTLWERGIWDDQDERIIVDDTRIGGGESLDAMVVMPEGVGDGGKHVVVGVGDGSIRVVKLGVNKVIGELLRHDDVEGVVALGFDVGGRLISGGGSTVKVWQEEMNLEDDDEDEESDEEVVPLKRALGSDDDSDNADSSDEEAKQKRRRKKTRTKGKDKSAGNGILKFKGLE